MSTSVTINFYENFTLEVLKGTYDPSTQAYKVALLDGTYAPDAAAHTVFSDVSASEIAAANGYTSGGVQLTNVSWAEALGESTFNSDDPMWTATGGPLSAKYWVLYEVNTGKLMLYGLLDMDGSSVSVPDGQNFTIAASAVGWFTLGA